jgi:5-formyltetrahydrofolate cyclo-ligase
VVVLKQHLRKQFLELRSSLSESEYEEKCSSIEKDILSNPLFIKADTIMTYIDFRGEVRTRKIIDYCLKNNKRVVIPVCLPKTKTLMLSELKDFDQDLKSGHFGVLEPREDKIRPVEASGISLILVPGAVFDKTGYRIGYGAGYYDKFLSGPGKGIATIGLAFQCQIIDSVPKDAYDIPVDYIAAEEGLINCIKNRL